MKQIFYIIVLSIFIREVSSQTISGLTTSVSTGEQDTLDFTKLCVIYSQSFQLDSLNKKRIQKSEMILQIGNSISKYSNYKSLINDSIIHTKAVGGMLNPKEVNAGLSRMKGAGDLTVIFKGYPANNTLLYRETIGDPVSYEENNPTFSWEIFPDETVEILGYLCQKARCSFRGRYYIAWFSPELPLDNGPWKFSGLPGLVLKVEDSKKEFLFECISIFQPTWKSPITYKIRNREVKTTREKFNQAKARHKENPIRNLANAGRYSATEEELTKTHPYNPIELY